MTIVAAVKSRDGLVLGTDSMTHVVGGAPGAAPTFVKAYENATKLFRIGDYQIAAATWGAGNIGPQSVGGIVLDFAATLTKAPGSMQSVADGFAGHVGKLYDATFATIAEDKRPVLGFLVGGYSVGQALPELWEIRFPFAPGGKARVQIVRQPEDFGANWRGVELPFTRVHFGFDTRLIEKVVAMGVKPEDANKMLSQFQSPVIFDSMPIQDAIEFAKYVLRTTISFSTFEVGVPSCGEPLQLAVVLRRTGFQWVEEPRFHV
jgi:hypothetical protein